MPRSKQLVVFALDDQKFGLDLSRVARIVRAVEITPLPEAPSLVPGVINIEGEIVPVINSRQRLSIREREIELSDHFIVVNGLGTALALIADKVEPVLEVTEDRLVYSGASVPTGGCVEGVAKMEDGLIILLDVEKMLLSDEVEPESIRVSLEAIGTEE